MKIFAAVMLVLCLAACGSLKGGGKQRDCTRCTATGRLTCQTCMGRKVLGPCHTCLGSGVRCCQVCEDRPAGQVCTQCKAERPGNDCLRCQGSGRRGEATCTLCRGTGRRSHCVCCCGTTPLPGSEPPAPHPRGPDSVACGKCAGTGTHACTACAATGLGKCSTCDGRGWTKSKGGGGRFDD